MRDVFQAIIPSSITIVAALSAAPALAQSTQPEDDAGRTGISEIVVTAEKRPSTEQKTAIAMTVISPEVLEKNSVSDLASIARIAPGVSFAAAGPSTIISIRGVSSRDTSEIGDPAVSISIDGFNLQRALGLNTSMFDLERVEVLRGPQGTLLGRNATGGAINIITAKPKDEFGAYLGGEIGNYRTYNTKGMINVPVTDTLQVRAAFQTRDHDGYRNNAPAKDGDDDHSRAVRLHVLYEPTDKLSILASAEYAEQNGVGPVTNNIPLAYYTSDNVPDGLLVGDIDLSTPSRGSGKTYAIAPGSFLKTRSWIYRTEIDYDLGFGSLTYQGGYRRLKVARRTLLGGAYGTSAQNLTFGQTENLPSWNHELRLSSNGDGPFKWQFGGFYFQEKNDLRTQFQDYPDSDGIYGTPFVIQDYVYPDILSRAQALFGQVSYEVVPGLSVEAGMRYSKDQKHRNGYKVTVPFSSYMTNRCDLTNTCVYTTTTQASSTKSSEPTYHAAINYQATPNNLFYAKFDTGYKAGGFTDIAEYKPEKVKAFEIGAKNRFLGNTLQANLSAFYYDYTDQQVSQNVVLDDGTVGTIVRNAGKSHYKGAELDLLYQPTNADRFNVYVGYVHARYVDFKASVSGQLARLATSQGRLDENSNYVLDGFTPPQSPDWTFNLGYEHDFYAFGGKLTPSVQSHIETKSYFTFYNLELDKQKAYSRTDLTLSFTPDSKQWTVTAFVRNLEDQLILTSAQYPSATYGTYREQYAPPRTFGAGFTYNF